jgi:hypothetical protein
MPNLHFRVTAEQKAEIEARARVAGYAKLSPYLRDRALDNRSTASRDSQAKAERVAGSTGSAAPVVERPPETPEQYIERRTRALYAQGLTSRLAETQAEREWREAHPDTEETE